jgi:23S rRNA (adenine2503-C2)-methyltransferase
MSESEDAMDRVDMKSLPGDDLVEFVVDHGHPSYRGIQLYRWLYLHGASSFDEMSDLPLAFRDLLNEKCALRTIRPVTEQVSADSTLKTLYELESGNRIETVLIPDFDDDHRVTRVTVCVSSQVGCAMGCTFCATGRMGFQQNLTAGEIYDQVLKSNALSILRFLRPISNIVFMGMGEPLLNYDAVMESIKRITNNNGLSMAPKRVTVSTVGLSKRIRQLADDDNGVNLAVSLHAPTNSRRSSIIPVNRQARTDLGSLKEAIVHYSNKTGRKVTYEYCMFHGFNDSAEDARHLADVVSWAPSKVNLIMYNAVAGTPFRSTPEETLNRFIRTLVSLGVRVTVRRSRGQDIDAACGQLASS